MKNRLDIYEKRDNNENKVEKRLKKFPFGIQTFYLNLYSTTILL